MSHGPAQDSVMMQVPNVGAFVRALLPVKLTESHTVTIGVWLAVHPRDLEPACGSWRDPAGEHLHLDAWLANAIPPWGMLACPVEAAVRDPSQAPCCVSSPDETVNRVLTGEWDHDLVLEGIRAGEISGSDRHEVPGSPDPQPR